MNRIYSFAVSVFAALTLSSLTPVNAADTDPTFAEVQAKIAAMFDAIDPEDISTSPVDGWYTVQKGQIIAYVSADGRFLMQGDLIDLDTSTNLTEASRNTVRRELVAALRDDESILFAPEETRHSVTVFTDIDCTYCRKLHNEIQGYMDRGIAVRYVLYPRNGQRSRAWNTSENVWCAKDRNGALTAAKADRKFTTTSCDASMVARHYKLGQDIGLTGTPAIILEDGTLVSGYLPPAQLSMRLAHATSGSAQ